MGKCADRPGHSGCIVDHSETIHKRGLRKSGAQIVRSPGRLPHESETTSVPRISFASLIVRRLCYIFQSLLREIDEENQSTVHEWGV